MSESIGYLGEQYEHLKAQINEAEKAANNLPYLREKLAEVAERIKQYVSPQTVEAEPEAIEPMADLSGEETWSKLEEINERNFPDLRPNGGYTPPPAETD